MTINITQTARMPNGNILAWFDNGWCKVFEENECTTCWRKGGTLELDTDGDGVWAMLVIRFDPCPDCLDKGLCPGCGNKTLNIIEENIVEQTCVICDWQYNSDRFYPEPDCAYWDNPLAH